MHAWLYDTLITSEDLQLDLGGEEGIAGRVLPRRSQTDISVPRPFLVYGMGNATNEQLGDSTANDVSAERQFFQVWIHDEGGGYDLINSIIPEVIRRLDGGSHVPSRIIVVTYLETSGEFSNETYNTLFRYIRFQAIRAQGKAL